MRSLGQSLRVDEPAVYEVRVQGWVGGRWNAWLHGMEAHLEGQGEVAAFTVLSGSLADQAALLGLLQRLHNLGFPLLAVTRREFGNREATETSVGQR